MGALFMVLFEIKFMFSILKKDVNSYGHSDHRSVTSVFGDSRFKTVADLPLYL